MRSESIQQSEEKDRHDIAINHDMASLYSQWRHYLYSEINSLSLEAFKALFLKGKHYFTLSSTESSLEIDMDSLTLDQKEFLTGVEKSCPKMELKALYKLYRGLLSHTAERAVQYEEDLKPLEMKSSNAKKMIEIILFAAWPTMKQVDISEFSELLINMQRITSRKNKKIPPAKRENIKAFSLAFFSFICDPDKQIEEQDVEQLKEQEVQNVADLIFGVLTWDISAAKKIQKYHGVRLSNLFSQQGREVGIELEKRGTMENVLALAKFVEGKEGEEQAILEGMGEFKEFLFDSSQYCKAIRFPRERKPFRTRIDDKARLGLFPIYEEESKGNLDVEEGITLNRNGRLEFVEDAVALDTRDRMSNKNNSKKSRPRSAYIKAESLATSNESFFYKPRSRERYLPGIGLGTSPSIIDNSFHSSAYKPR